jgi:hypothetical protein
MRGILAKVGGGTALAVALLAPPASADLFLGNPADPNCHGQTISHQARSHGGAKNAATEHGFASVKEGQEFVKTFCGTGNR